MFNSSKRALVALAALLGACVVTAGAAAVGPAHAANNQGWEAVVYAYDTHGQEVPATVSTAVGSHIVSTVTIDTDQGQLTSTIATDLAAFSAACAAGAVDGDELDPAMSSVITVGAGGTVDSSVSARVYDWDGDFLADISTVATIERGYNDRFIVFVETKLADLGIEIGPGGGYELKYDCGYVTFACPNTGSTRANTLSTLVGVRPAAEEGQFVADREGKDFATFVNRILFHYKVEVDKNGVVTLGPTTNQGPLPPDRERAERALVDIIGRLIKDGKTKITFIHGDTSKDPKDAQVVVGSYPQGKIDLDDIGKFGEGAGTNAAAVLAHELEEQYQKQIKGKAYPDAHAAGNKVELEISGAAKVDEPAPTKRADGSWEIIKVFTYADGRVIRITVTMKVGNITVDRTDIKK